ncbi:MAG: UbiD family decarboxylase [Thermodesulfobacteriota bacterium]|nr:UbiD family decarboxylase [Thermodesulfobacteriota bacterium]
MSLKDLRGWIELLQKENEVKEITCEVDWNLEIAEIETRLREKREGGPALLFSNIKDYHDTLGRKFFIGSLGSYSKIAMSLGLPKDTPPLEIMKSQREKSKNLIKPIQVSTGPIKQNIVKGDDIDIFQFPVLKSHDRDGGRYISTFNGVVTKDPETGWTNVGLYRGMVHEDGKSIGVLLAMATHWGMMAAKYAKMKKPMEVAFVFGGDPLLPYAACSPYMPHVCEYDIIGGLRGEPMELVKCETIDLHVPAHAEIVIEGTVSLDPKDFRIEGPFGEYTGFYGGRKSPKPSFDATCITFRDDPILQGSVEGPPYDEGALIHSITASSFALDYLEQNCIIPGVLDAWVPPVTHGNDVFVKIKKQYQGQAKQIAAALWGATLWWFKNVFVVDEDVDIHDYDQLLWAFSWRVWDYDEDLSVFRGCHGGVLDPSTPPELKDPAKMGGSGRWNRLCIDATKDWRLEPVEEWGGERFPPLNRYLPTPEKVQKRWKEYGID